MLQQALLKSLTLIAPKPFAVDFDHILNSTSIFNPDRTDRKSDHFACCLYCLA
jgi:hypothetical protein